MLNQNASAGTKLGIAFGSLMISILGLLLPTKCEFRPRLTASANLFTGGLILSTALVHLLADATESDGDGFPWACCLLGVGYGLLLSVDSLASSSKDTQDDIVAIEERETLTARIQIKAHDHRPDSGFVATLALVIHSVGDGLAVALQRSSHKLLAISGAILVHKFFASYALGTLLMTLPTSKEVYEHKIDHEGAFSNNGYTIRKKRTTSPLPLHASQEEHKEASHDSTSYYSSHPQKTLKQDDDALSTKFQWWRRPLYATTFAVATPLSICAVVFGDTASERFAATIKNASFVDRTTALCAGSLLYISIHEILPSALDTPSIPSASTKLSIFWLGFIVMSILALWT